MDDCVNDEESLHVIVFVSLVESVSDIEELWDEVPDDVDDIV